MKFEAWKVWKLYLVVVMHCGNGVCRWAGTWLRISDLVKNRKFCKGHAVRIGSKLAHSCVEMRHAPKKKLDLMKPGERGLRLRD